MKICFLLTTLLIICGCASSFESGRTTPELTSEQIQKAFDRDASKIFSVYNKALISSPELRGRVVFIVSAFHDKSNECEVEYADKGLGSISQEICIVIQGMNFGYGSKLDFAYPIMFSPDSNFN